MNIPEPNAGDADFSKMVAVGGNYLAGYQDGALYKKGQSLSIPALLAEQFKLVGGPIFNQALMPDDNGLGLNSKIWESWFVTPSHLGYKTNCEGVTSLSPLKNAISNIAATPYLSGIAGNSVQNLAVPFATVSDYFNPAFGLSSFTGNTNPFYARLASNPGVSTLYGDVHQQNATFITAWLGMEDIFNYASRGGTGAAIPSATSFANYLDSILGGLTANGAKGVIANIPDFRSFPYYTLVAWDNAELRQTQADSLNDIYIPAGLTNIFFVEGRNGFVIDDPSVFDNIRQLHAGEYITLSAPIDSMKCYKYGLLINTINDRYALDSSEVYEIDQATSAYNSIIAQKANQYNLAFVDMNSYLKKVVSGIKWNGVDFNAEFVSGGFFSLDGYHPNQKGYALIANEFIRSINSKYNAFIPDVYCTECDGVKFP
ncbi:MAG: SGNH/GDSL hydrolase family protein [Bacteroidetes bacterium]|nr:SGNH/GDSL hydrolase family protein [Bacteroidota bacterium]